MFTCSHAFDERESQLLTAQTETHSQPDFLENPEFEFPLPNPWTVSTDWSQNVNLCDREMHSNVHFSLDFSLQKLQTFQSLSCPGFSASDNCQSSLPPPSFETAIQSESDFTAVSELGLESRQDVIGDDEEEDSSYEELDSDSACSVDSRSGSPVHIVDSKRTLWKGDCGTQRDIFQLGGELDIDQIERNWTFLKILKECVGTVIESCVWYTKKWLLICSARWIVVHFERETFLKNLESDRWKSIWYVADFWLLNDLFALNILTVWIKKHCPWFFFFFVWVFGLTQEWESEG